MSGALAGGLFLPGPWTRSGTTVRLLTDTDTVQIGVEPGTSGVLNVDPLGVWTRRPGVADRRLLQLSGNVITLVGDASTSFLDLTTLSEVRFQVGGVSMRVTATTILMQEPVLWNYGGAFRVDAMVANLVLVLADASHQFLDPNGARRDVQLTAEAVSDGLTFWITNTAFNITAFSLDVMDDGGATIALLAPGETGYFKCDGVTWERINFGTPVSYVAAFQLLDLTLTSINPATDATDIVLTLPVGTWVVTVRTVWQSGAGSTDGYLCDWDFTGTEVAERTITHFNNNTATLANTFRSTNIAADSVVTGVGGNTFFTKEEVSIVVTVAGTLTYRAAKRFDAGADTTLRALSYASAIKAAA